MNRKLLREKIDASGYKLRYIADQLGISYPGFNDKLTGKTDFKVSEVHKIQNLLNLTEQDLHDIFFA